MAETGLEPPVGVETDTRGRSEHARDGGAVQIGVEYADPLTRQAQGRSQVDADGGFADATLAAGDQNDVAHARHGPLRPGVDGVLAGCQRSGCSLRDRIHGFSAPSAGWPTRSR